MSKALPAYIRIYEALKDMKRHNKKDFCRPLSEDTKRLREMRKFGWVEYDYKTFRDKDGNVLYTEYWLTKVHDSWFIYYHKHIHHTVEPNGQYIFI